MRFDVQSIRAQFPILARESNGHPLAYLDNAASSFGSVFDMLEDDVMRESFVEKLRAWLAR